jgi:hypothetical protein
MAQQITPTTLLRVFKTRIPSMRYAFGNGKIADFIKGKFYTCDPLQIAELESQVAAGHQYIFIDPAEIEIESEDRDPNVALRKKIRAELLEEMRNRQEIEIADILPGRLNAASTKDIAPVALGSSAGSPDALKAAIAKKVG